MEKNKNFQSKIINVTFLLLIFGVFILSIFYPKRAYSTTENRFLAQAPKVSVDAIFSGKLRTDYENYVTDQFPMRDGMITVKTLTELAMQKKEINGVYFADDDYLIEAHTAEEIETEQLEKNLKSVYNFIKTQSEVLGQGNVKLMLVPTANEVLKDKLPAFVSDYDQGKLLDEVYNELKANGNEAAFVDVLSEMKLQLEREPESYLYYRTDHHWTTLGAYYGYLAFAKSCGYVPDVNLSSSTADVDYTLEVVHDKFYGTITSKININTKPDEITLFHKSVPSPIEVRYDMMGAWGDSLYDFSKLETTDEYEVFQGGNHGLVEIKTQVDNGKKLLVVKDSYANCMLPFLTNHYEEIHVLDLRFFNLKVTDYMKMAKFDEILILYNIPNFATENTVFNIR